MIVWVLAGKSNGEGDAMWWSFVVARRCGGRSGGDLLHLSLLILDSPCSLDGGEDRRSQFAHRRTRRGDGEASAAAAQRARAVLLPTRAATRPRAR